MGLCTSADVATDNLDADDDSQIVPDAVLGVTPSDIVEFWFGKLESKEEKLDETKVGKWFKGGKAFDEEIATKFGEFMTKILEQDPECVSSWEQSAMGILALILVTDQFTRNVYRNTAKMFAYDERAVKYYRMGEDQSFGEELFALHPVYTKFYMMPLLHSEDLKDQEECMRESIKYFQEQLDESNPSYRFLSNMEFNEEHLDVIKECGRFPQRNHLLDPPRETTEKEKEIMKKYNLMRLIDQSEE